MITDGWGMRGLSVELAGFQPMALAQTISSRRRDRSRGASFKHASGLHRQLQLSAGPYEAPFMRGTNGSNSWLP